MATPGQGAARAAERKAARAVLLASENGESISTILARRRHGSRALAEQSRCQKCNSIGHWTYECKNERQASLSAPIRQGASAVAPPSEVRGPRNFLSRAPQSRPRPAAGPAVDGATAGQAQRAVEGVRGRSPSRRRARSRSSSQASSHTGSSRSSADRSPRHRRRRTAAASDRRRATSSSSSSRSSSYSSSSRSSSYSSHSSDRKRRRRRRRQSSSSSSSTGSGRRRSSSRGKQSDPPTAASQSRGEKGRR